MKKTTIRCPYCNNEYLPAEIFLPNEFLGEPENIIKNDAGDILGFNGNDMNTVETYVCDKCGKSFSVEASVTFKTAMLKDLFEDDPDFFKSIKNKKD